MNPCAGVECPEGQECSLGDCLDRVCPDGCGEGEFCSPDGCIENPCAGVECAAEQFCRDGMCFDACINRACGAGRTCGWRVRG